MLITLLSPSKNFGVFGVFGVCLLLQYTVYDDVTLFSVFHRSLTALSSHI